MDDLVTKSIKKAPWGSLFLILFLTCPYLILLSQFSFDLKINSSEFMNGFKNSLVISFGSSFASLALGILGGLGLFWLQRVAGKKISFVFEILILIPSLIPSFFVILSVLSVIEPFPFGWNGVILVHSIINVGLVSLLINKLIYSKLKNIGALCLIEGASSWRFLRTALFGYLRPDLIYLFIFIFISSLVSFNVPLLVGGLSGRTLEVLIYEKIVIEQNWSSAIGLSLVQMVLIFGVSRFQTTVYVDTQSKDSNSVLRLAEWRWGLILPIVAFGIVFVSPMQAILNGIQQIQVLKLSFNDYFEPIIFSLLIALMSGVFLFCIAMLVLIYIDSKVLQKFLKIYMPPGAVLIGFSFLILQRGIFLPVSFAISLGLTLLYFTSLYRMSLASSVEALQGQREVAIILGADRLLIFKKIIFPQMIKPLVLFAALGSMWACGDFALSKILSSHDFHLALVVKSLASQYRLDAAQLLALILYFISILLFVFWWSIGYVASRKFESESRTI